MKTLIKYSLTGVMNTAVDYAIFALLNAVFGMHYLLAQTFSYALATVNSYVVNRKWTFRRTGRAKRDELLKFLAVNALMFGLSTAILALFHGFLDWNTLISKGIAIFVATGAGFSLNKLWVFRHSETLEEVTKVAESVESHPGKA
ncbi:Putative flippase GtrA (transmembrane translocase of bactoprenol-linked glucose) [Paenibacillaceae bacterium GAS479]|nr:Putative flippase GtrA (transmembrane translocase of bactoprenol-linked glucose) [Paenibacillaceae bacterium GAS479]